MNFHGEDEDDGADSSGGMCGSNGIFEWRIILTLDPAHDSLDDSSVIGKAGESPYCCLPRSASGGEKKSGGILAGVTRAAKSKSSSSSSANDDGAVASQAGGAAYFAFKFAFPPNYPFKPPVITVLSNTYHPNISTKSGEICDSVLTGEDWGPTLNVRKVCARLRKFLCDPDPDHPLESVIAQLLVDKPEEYAKAAFKHAGENATKAQAIQAAAKGKK